MDIFVNSTKNNSITDSSSNVGSPPPPIYPYYLVLININTRYVELHYLQNKSSNSVLNVLKYIFNKLTIISLESDEEKSFLPFDILSYLKKHKVDYYVTNEQHHQSLGIIDRFIRTMRDYLKKNEPSNNDNIIYFLVTIIIQFIWKLCITYSNAK
jgi:hypothetical protein